MGEICITFDISPHGSIINHYELILNLCYAKIGIKGNEE